MTKCQHHWKVPPVTEGRSIESRVYRNETAVVGISVCTKCGTKKQMTLTWEPAEKRGKYRWNDGLSLTKKKSF